MTTTNKTRFATALTAVALLVLPACASGADDQPSSGGTTQSAAGQQTQDAPAAPEQTDALDSSLDEAALTQKLDEAIAQAAEAKDSQDVKRDYGRVAITWTQEPGTKTEGMAAQLAQRAIAASGVRNMTSAVVSPESISAIVANDQRAIRLAQANTAVESIAKALGDQAGDAQIEATVDDVTVVGRGDYRPYKAFTEVFAHHPEGYRIDTDAKSVSVDVTSVEQLQRCAKRADGFTAEHDVTVNYTEKESSFSAKPEQLAASCAGAAALAEAGMTFTATKTPGTVTVAGADDEAAITAALKSSGWKAQTLTKSGAGFEVPLA